MAVNYQATQQRPMNGIFRHRFKSSHFGKKIGLHFLTKLPHYRTRKHQKVALIGSKRPLESNSSRTLLRNCKANICTD